MAKETTRYLRKISGEEVENGYFLIQKDALSFFPSVGKYFKLKVGEHKFDSRIEAVDCLCRGPNKPHQHYRISTKYFMKSLPWNRGATFVISKLENKEYELTSG